MEFQDERYAGQTVRTDGNVYVGCDFDQAIVEYGGGELPRFTDCSFGAANFTFVDSAERTIHFLRGMGSMGTAGSDLVRKLLNLPF